MRRRHLQHTLDAAFCAVADLYAAEKRAASEAGTPIDPAREEAWQDLLRAHLAGERFARAVRMLAGTDCLPCLHRGDGEQCDACRDETRRDGR